MHGETGGVQGFEAVGDKAVGIAAHILIDLFRHAPAGALICGAPPVGPGLEEAAAAFRPSETVAVTTKRAASPAEIRAYANALYGSLDPIPELFFKAAPICVVHGAQDAFVSGDYLQTVLWRNLWSGRIHEFADSGHAPFIEEAARFNELLHQFLIEAVEE